MYKILYLLSVQVDKCASTNFTDWKNTMSFVTQVL